MSESQMQEGKILFIGDSITEGFLIPPGTDYPSRIQRRLKEKGIPLRVINGGRSGETSGEGLYRLPHYLQEENLRWVVIQFGYNDLFMGIPPEETRSNLKRMVRMVRDRNPDIRIGLLHLSPPPVADFPEGKEFKEIYPEVAEEESILLLGDPLEGVFSSPGLLQSDGVHPTEAGMKLVAENVWNSLEPHLPQPVKDESR